MASTISSTSTQSLVTALGGGSGIDMAALANNLAVAQFSARTDRLSAKSDKLNAQISSASNIKSMLFSLSSSLGDRVRQGDLSPQPKVANAAVAQAALSGTRQPKGSYSLEVTALAKPQTLASKAYASATSTVGAGTLTLRFGTVAGGTFTEDTGHVAASITIASGATLTDVAAAINGANAGVSAYVAQTVDGAQLVLKGKDGAANGFVLDASEASGEPGLAGLAWTPGSSQGQLLATASDAAFKIDGLSMTAGSNTVSEAIPGVKLNLTATNAGSPTTVSFADPSATITSAMSDLVSALNEIAGAVKIATDPLTGDLRSDGGARKLRNDLSRLAGTTIMPNATGAAKTLADLGVSTQRDGTFTLDTARLAATMAKDPDGVAAMFTTGLYGVYSSVDKLYRGASSTTDPGSLGGSISRYTSQLKQVAEDQTSLADDQEKLRASLAARFAVSENRVSASKSTLSFLQNQIAAWNKSTN
ncbi:flagellar filament capping protein FliD [Novosphingobium album (ex Liu et al. 2023)]|uniref:Flagellar hook-associated protein 2 n=1 Tax=Novosphingobium album (ex Liu et al. 2023) TaxID=3031130 RepID=A0ABT5WM57_9SPHN|nr:flagellar filament capping protein FliD [Novosphingobium album (ex Liu et al. 2023)]MDE8651121.1 flagellar filament capping protein FliD [Novosphingobium album (ex Liu et al. 2023)]